MSLLSHGAPELFKWCRNNAKSLLQDRKKTYHILYKCIPLEVISLFLNHRGLAFSSGQTDLHLNTFCLFFLKLGLKEELPGASWSYCVPGLVSQEQLRGKVPTSLFLAPKWVIIFGNTHRLAGANGCVFGGLIAPAFSFFDFQL